MRRVFALLAVLAGAASMWLLGTGAAEAATANNNFSAATTLAGPGGQVTADSAALSTNTAESGEPAHAGIAASRSAWWKFTTGTSVSAPVALSTASATFG